MSLSPFVSSISTDIRKEITAEIIRIEQENQVKVIFAIESGSRAWGFPSPDSDYDVRFIYAHPTSWYLSIFPGRDVIERPISDELDISGWDIRKALALLIKPNPVMFEWLSSPIRFRWNDTLCNELVSFSRKTTHTTACLYHYLNLGNQQFMKHMESNNEVLLKKYFYVLRPALAIRWMRKRPDDIPPMNIQSLTEGTNLDGEILLRIDDLILRKSQMDENKYIARIPVLDAFINNEFNWAQEADKKKPDHRLIEEASRLFQNILISCDQQT